MSFDAKKYWEERENPNATCGHSQAPKFIYEYLRPRLAGKESILELGPGVGRTLDVYSPSQSISTLDLSTRYSDKVEKRASALGLSLFQHFLDAPGDRFPFTDDAFDVGVCVQVLMHVPPEFINVTMGELLRICQVSLIVTALKLPPHSKANHVFEHDYKLLVSGLGCEITEFTAIGNTACFTVE